MHRTSRSKSPQIEFDELIRFPVKHKKNGYECSFIKGAESGNYNSGKESYTKEQFLDTFWVDGINCNMEES